VSHGSNLYRKDNPRWAIGNAMETPRVPVRGAWALCVAWLIGLPRRAGTRLHARNDAEARWRHWQVTERHGGLVRQYRDARFDVLRYDPTIRRDNLDGHLVSSDPAPPDRACPGGC
jgi:hypothetical protein